jgi:hypothetical protein
MRKNSGEKVVFPAPYGAAWKNVTNWKGTPKAGD